MATSGEKSCTVDDQSSLEQTQDNLPIASEADIHPPIVERLQVKRASGKGNQCCGYECELVQRPPEALQTDCSICLMVLRKPHIISCCGQSFCQSCIDRIKTDGRSCPLCSATGFSIIHNRGLENTLKEFEVRCTYATSGCKWVGKMRLLDDHLNLDCDNEKQLEGCGFVEITCNHKCGGVFPRSMLANHQGEECPKRPFSCDYCREYASTFEDVANNHWPVCECYPISCPNQCTPYAIERQHFEDHLSKDCPLTVVNCDFHYAGCEVQLPRKDMPAHLAENFTHISLLAAMNQKLAEKLLKKDEEISKLSQELKEMMAKLDKEKEQLERENTELKNELTKKHESVHELSTTLRQEIDRSREERATMKQEIQLEIDKLRKKQATDTHSLKEKQEQDRMELDKKEKAHEQRWKQQTSSVSTTLRQEIDRSRRERVTMKQQLQLEIDQLRKKQATDTQSLAQDMTDLGKKQEQDRTELDKKEKAHEQRWKQQTSSVSITLRQEIDRSRRERVTMKQQLQLEIDQLRKKQATDTQSLAQDMTDLGKKQEQDRTELDKKEKAHEQRLKQQTSSVQGLSFTLRQEADRSRRERATMKQELQLKIDQLQKKQATNTQSLAQDITELREKQEQDRTELDKKEKVHEQRLKQQASSVQVKMSQLQWKQETDTKRLAQDITDLREKQMKDRTELERQATTLERVDAHIRSVPFQITMPDFEKHKAANDQWYSEPFYTHPRGYKMCISVHANGNGSAKQTHISVFAYLMRGMFDEHLKWPLTCNITIELLDQKENEGHRKILGNSVNGITFTDRVTKGERTVNGYGKPAFISHAELYRHRDDFINNGCIRFQITKIELNT